MPNTEKEFVNLKVHTQYSICEGAIKIDELTEHCKLNRTKSIGLCDNYNLCGALEFAEKISKVGTQPIIGTQVNFKAGGVIGKLPLFAKSNVGYKNIIKISSESYLKTDEKSEPHCDLEVLKKYGENIILLSGNHNDLFGKLFKLNKLKIIEENIKYIKDTYKDRFYFEIQRHNDPGEKIFENYLIQLSDKFEIPIIATQEIYYMNENMYEAHDALTCIGTKSFVDDSQRIKLNNTHYIKKDEELKSLFSDIPEALENNYNFPFRFNFKPKKSSPILPTIETKKIRM